MKRWITLTTDFGDSHYVGQMKGVLARLVPEVPVIDITHAVPPQSIVMGAMVLADSVPHFPDGSIHIAVVDPGVGTDRPLVAADFGGHVVIGPDNGLLSELSNSLPLKRIIRLDQPRWWSDRPSRTFHGRDKMAYMAAWLAKGESLEHFGSAQASLHPSPIPNPEIHSRRILGTTLCADSFGNLITNIKHDHWDLSIGNTPRVRLPDIGISAAWADTYGQSSPNQCVSLIGSSGRLEVSIVNGNAAKLFQTHTTAVELSW